MFKVLMKISMNLENAVVSAENYSCDKQQFDSVWKFDSFWRQNNRDMAGRMAQKDFLINIAEKLFLLAPAFKRRILVWRYPFARLSVDYGFDIMMIMILNEHNDCVKFNMLIYRRSKHRSYSINWLLFRVTLRFYWIFCKLLVSMA
jgi:hypothetical protein